MMHVHTLVFSWVSNYIKFNYKFACTGCLTEEYYHSNVCYIIAALQCASVGSTMYIKAVEKIVKSLVCDF